MYLFSAHFKLKIFSGILLDYYSDTMSDCLSYRDFTGVEVNTSYVMHSSRIPWNIPRVTCIFFHYPTTAVSIMLARPTQKICPSFQHKFSPLTHAAIV